MLCKKPKSKLYKKIRKLIIIFLILLSAVVVFFEAQAIPFCKKCVVKQAKASSELFISKAVNETLNKLNYTYDDLAIPKYSSDGSLKAIATDSVKINRIKADVTLKIQQKLDREDMYSFKAPLGAFTGLTMINNSGPKIYINFILSGSVSCKIKSSFESGGVNQTIHHIYLVVKTNMITISPEFEKSVKNKTYYEIAQTVIVGNVPSTYADINR